MAHGGCSKCNVQGNQNVCHQCVRKELSLLTTAHDYVLGEIATRRTQVEEFFQLDACSSSSSSCESISILDEVVSRARRRIEAMKVALHKRREELESRQRLLGELGDRQEARRKKFNPRSEFLISFDEYLRHSSRYERTLSALHPFRKLRGVAHSLAEERKRLCQEVLSMFRLRPVMVGGGSELVADFTEEEGSNTSVAAGMIVCILVLVAQVLDIPLPFPIAMGTIVSSPCLHNAAVAYETGCAPYARILHRYKRVILPVTGDPSLSSQALLMENLRYLTGFTHVGADPVQLLALMMSSAHLGKEFVSQRSHPSSPSLSGSCSPSSSSYRRSVIEQSVTEGGEWTLLDQL